MASGRLFPFSVRDASAVRSRASSVRAMGGDIASLYAHPPLPGSGRARWLLLGPASSPRRDFFETNRVCENGHDRSYFQHQVPPVAG
jgi:hypothetical protein